MINGMGEDEYNVRLLKTKLLSLEMRRLRSDLIEVFKIMHNLEGVKREDFFQLRIDTGRRGHSLTILKQHCRLNVRKYFFTHRVVDTWNKMSEDTVYSKTVNIFKNQIDPWFKQHGGLYISQRRLHAPVIQTHGHTATNWRKPVGSG